MTFFLYSLSIFLVSGLLALISKRSAFLSSFFGIAGCVAGCVLGLIPSIQVLLSGQGLSFSFPWAMPLGAFVLNIDFLSAFFLVPVFVLCALAGLYGGQYLYSYRSTHCLGFSWFCFNILVGSMALVIVAANALLFLLAWELMALASFFLVIFEAKKESVRKAGWMYLITTHIGTAFLLAMFLLMAQSAKSMNFMDWDKLEYLPSLARGIFFILAVVGFGAKAGFMPLHIWLPEAHPAAPSHVSSVMSGVMIKTGIYGLIRILSFLGFPSFWWGWTLLAIGIISGVLGILFALAQSDLKRLLAYSTVENVGIITMGLGITLLGIAYQIPVLTVIGFVGSLFHVLNHALYKGLLFLCAGAVLHGTGMRDINLMGGLLKRMRYTGLFFLAGAIAICGLPPLNGFGSEFLIYFACFTGGIPGSHNVAIPALALIIFLSLIGGLSIACFSKAFGIAFSGEPRHESMNHAHDTGWLMKIPMGILALSCILVGFLSPCLLPRIFQNYLSAEHLGILEKATFSLSQITIASIVFLFLLGILALVRSLLLCVRKVETTVTWDCGYAAPTARMQYTGTSFSQILVEFYNFFLRVKQKLSAPKGLFPEPGSFSMETPDLFQEKVFSPLFVRTGNVLCILHTLQHGRIHLYVLYIIVMLIVLLLWKL